MQVVGPGHSGGPSDRMSLLGLPFGERIPLPQKKPWTDRSHLRVVLVSVPEECAFWQGDSP